MSKKLPLILVAMFLAFATYGQTIVSTTPQNKSVVLEEFTGIHCGFCPSGHQIAKAIQDANPDRVSIINIHAGSYATPGPSEPDFRTPFGNALVNQSFSGGNFGFPAGTVNRHVFPGREMASGGGTAMGRGFWAVSASEILAMPSYVNVAVEANIDVQTRVLTVHVEAYYTGDSPESTNLINVALLQNNTKGPQSGGSAGNNYNHMHRLVHLITGQWGETINTTTAGTFVDRTFTYTIPENFNNMVADLAEMEVVAYISETHQEVPTGSRTTPTFTGITLANDANIRSITPIDPTCMNSVAPIVNIKNEGQNTLTSLAIEYEINGEPHTYNWTGEISAMHNKDIELPATSFTLGATNTLSVTLPTDENNTNNTHTINFNEAVEGTGNINLNIRADAYAYEFRWEIRNSQGAVVESGRNYPNGSITNVAINLAADCYTFHAFDTYGDGGTYVRITDSEGTQLFMILGNWGATKTGQFSSNGVLNVNQNVIGNINIYPNPTRDILNITDAENADIQVFDLLGKMILSKENISSNEQLNVSSLKAGVYFAKISKEGNTITKKFIVAK